MKANKLYTLEPKYKIRCIKLTSIALILSLTACGTITGIPAHGGGKRFATEQRLVSASIRSSLKDIDLSPLRGKKVAVVFDIIADEGGGTLSGGRFNVLGNLAAGYLTSPVTAASSAFQLFNLNDSGTNYSNTSNGGSNVANTTFVSSDTGSSQGTFNQSNSGNSNQTNQSNTTGSNTNTDNSTFSQNGTSSNNNTSNTTGNNTGTTSETTTGVLAGTTNGTSSGTYQQNGTTAETAASTTNGTNNSNSAGNFSQNTSGSESASNTSTTNGTNANTSTNNTTGNNNQTGNFSNTSNQIGGYSNNRQAISNEASSKITQTKGTESKRGVSLEYKGLGEYQNFNVPKSDASLLMGLVRNYMLLNHINPAAPNDPTADAIMYVTVDIFGIVRSRFDAYVYNQETLKAETSFEMMAFDRNGQILLSPRTANREAQYAERYLLWAGPFRTDEKVRKGKGLLVDFSDVDGQHKTYGADKVDASYPFGKN